jgi:hypothetical protein
MLLPSAVAQSRTAAAPEAPASVERRASDEVTVRLNATPSTAEIWLDDERVPTPYEGRVPRDTKAHVGRIEAPGFDPRTESIPFVNDTTIPVRAGQERRPLLRPHRKSQGSTRPIPGRSNASALLGRDRRVGELRRRALEGRLQRVAHR